MFMVNEEKAGSSFLDRNKSLINNVYKAAGLVLALKLLKFVLDKVDQWLCVILLTIHNVVGIS